MRAIVVFAVTLILAGCMTLVQPDTYQQRLAYAAGSVSASRATCADHYLRGSMTKVNAEKCLMLTDQAFAMIETARATPGGETQLQAALAILLQVEALLQAQEK